MSRERREALDAMLRDAPLDLGADVGKQREIVAQMMQQTPVPDDVRTVPETPGGAPALAIETPGADPARVTVHLRGGAYAIGTSRLPVTRHGNRLDEKMGHATMSSRSRAPRSDALANRERLLGAANAAIRARGDGVPMAEIAAMAQVGVGTLYRHFPTRESLVAALTHRSLESVLRRVNAAADLPGHAIDAIGWFLHETIAHRDELILPLHGAPPITDPDSIRLQQQIRERLTELLDRGRDDHSIAAEITARDVITTGAMLAQPLPNATNWDERAHRQAQIYLAGLRALPS